MRFRTSCLAAFAAMLIAGTPLAFGATGSVAAGRTKSATCSACHGVHGRGVAPNFPALAGQNEVYLINALREFKDGRRTNAIMNAMAARLTLEDIKDLAAYYASLPCSPPQSQDKG